MVLSEGIDVSGVDLTAAPEPARAPGGIFGATSQSAFEPRPRRDTAPAAVPDEGPTSTSPATICSRPPIATSVSGPPTQLFKPFAESDDPLGPPDDEADKAMRAFFEADFETSDPEQQKSRFGFRR